MRKRATWIVFLSFCLALPPAAGAWDSNRELEVFLYDGTTTTRLTDDFDGAHHLRINNAGQLVWYQFDGTDDEILFYDGTDIVQITDNDTQDYFPEMNDLGHLVWASCDGGIGDICEGGDYEVYLYDGAGITRITNREDHDYPQAINNSGQIAISGYNGTDYDVYFYDGTSTTQITDNALGDEGLVMNQGGQMAWHTGFDFWGEIYFWDGTQVIKLTQDIREDRWPKIADNGHVAWRTCDGGTGQWCEGGDYEIMLYDGTSTIQLTDNDYDDDYQEMGGSGHVVWAAQDAGGDQEIFLYDGVGVTQITHNDYFDTQPVVNAAGQVAWIGTPPGSYGYEIFLYDGSSILQLTSNDYDDLLPEINDSGQVAWTADIPIACFDSDGDGYGDPADTDCTYPEEDCDDRDPAVHPGASEICGNGADDDCNGLTDYADPACPCQDGDGDGYGDPANSSCTHPELDCDDSDPAIHPGATEVCDNGIDEDCDGLIDAGDPDCPCADGDGDGYGDPANTSCSYPELDCDDSDAEVNPGHAEVAGNGVDDDCDGLVDEACFVATAAFGSERDARIEVLRAFRDARLVTNPVGRSFLRLYYAYSPPVADYVAERGWLRATVRVLLLPLIGIASLLA